MEGADAGFALGGVPISNVTHFSVPGAYELPFAAKQLAQTGTYAGVACLGVVIRGETDHYDFVCAEAARGIQDVQLETGVALRVRRHHLRHDGAGAGPRRRRQARPGAERGPDRGADGIAARAAQRRARTMHPR